jgi:hypothetical protein
MELPASQDSATHYAGVAGGRRRLPGDGRKVEGWKASPFLSTEIGLTRLLAAAPHVLSL